MFLIIMFLSLILLGSISSEASSQASFYEGKTIAIVSGRGPGGTGDQRVRSMIPFLVKYIPGSPTIVLQSMPGAGGRKAANHMYEVASPDGLTIGNIGAGFITSSFLGLPGVNYDIDKFTYLGSANSKTSYVFVTNAKRGFDSLKKLQAASGVRVGGQSVGHEIYVYGRLFAWLLNLKDPKFVAGFSGPELDVAVERGEVDARASVADNVPRRSPDWISKGLVNFHAVLEIPKGYRSDHPVYNKVPALHDFVNSDIGRKISTLVTNLRLVGSPNILPPGTPSRQADILREAFRKTFADPEWAKYFTKMTGEEAHPLTAEEQEKALKELPRDKEAVAVYRQIAGAGSLPQR